MRCLREERVRLAYQPVICARTGKPPLECVVVEHDWGIYQYVWDLVRAEATGEPIQSVKLPTTVEEAKAMVRVGSASLQGFAVT